MNILMVVTWCTEQGKDTLEAGVFHYEQSLNLVEHGCNVAIYYPYDQKISVCISKKEEWGVLTYRSKFIQGETIKNKKTIDKTMKQIVEEFRPDILHAHCAAGAGQQCVRFSKRYHLPLVITEHTPLQISKADKFGMSRFLSKKAFMNGNANICVSEFSKNELKNTFPKAEFKTIYNGIIMPKIQKNAEKRYYKEGYVNAVIVAVLYDKEIKGLGYLLKAMQMAKKNGKKIVLHHIGGGEYLEYFIDMAKELDILDVCFFYGRCEREKLYEIESEMDFFVSSSLTECSGVSVEEAMLLGKPILGTNSGGVDSLVPEIAGMIVEKANAEALRLGLEEMAEKISQYNQEEITNYAFENFEINNISEKYIRLYQSLISKK